MNRVVVIAAVAVFSVAGLLAAGFVTAADAPSGGGIAQLGKETLKYWNTGEPASGNPVGRASSDLDVKPPDPLFTCCAWGFTGGPERNNPYSGWYHPQQTVRLQVKDKGLMDQLIKASQDLKAVEVSLDGRTITGFKPLKED